MDFRLEKNLDLLTKENQLVTRNLIDIVTKSFDRIDLEDRLDHARLWHEFKLENDWEYYENDYKTTNVEISWILLNDEFKVFLKDEALLSCKLKNTNWND